MPENLQPIHIDSDTAVVSMPATGAEAAWLSGPLEELGLPLQTSAARMRVEAPAEWHWSAIDAAFLSRVLRHLRQGDAEVALQGLPQDLQNLLTLAAERPASGHAPPPEPGPVAQLGLIAIQHGSSMRAFIGLMGEVVLLLPRFVTLRARVKRSEMIDVLAESSSRALLIVGIVNVLLGGILAFVGAVQLRTFGAGIYVADLVGIASIRELTPIMTAIVLAGRTGASFAARIASMQGNEEVDALTTLGVSPVEFLVLPRVVALAVLMPLLYVYGCALALAGGVAVAAPILQLSATAYAIRTRDAVGDANFAIGGLKALLFGIVVALIGCHYGLRAERSAAGVGSATTTAVVSSIVAIIALDAVFAVCANALQI